MVTPTRTSVVDKLEKAREGDGEEGVGKEKRRRHGWFELTLIDIRIYFNQGGCRVVTGIGQNLRH